MSLVNLIGNLLTPNYDSLYMVDSPTLQEAVRDYNARIDGTVGTLVMNEQRTIEVLVEAKTENKVLNRIVTTAIPSKRDNQKEAGPSAVLKTEMTKYFWDTGKVTPYPLNAPKYFIFHSCPIFERTDKIMNKLRT